MCRRAVRLVLLLLALCTQGLAQITPLVARFVSTENLCRAALTPSGKECHEQQRMEGTYRRSDTGSELERVTVTDAGGATEMGMLRDVISNKVYRILYRAKKATEVGAYTFVSYRKAPVRPIGSRNIGGYDCVAVLIGGDRVKNGFKWINLANDLVVRREFDLMEDDGTWLETRQELSSIQIGAVSAPDEFRVPGGFTVLAPRLHAR